MPRELKLTTIDLRVDKELLLRSLLGVVHEKTVDRWTFSDDSDADLAICNVANDDFMRSGLRMDAAFSRAMIQLVDADSHPGQSGKVLGYPVKPAAFVDLLNSISQSLSTRESTRPGQPSPRNGSATPSTIAEEYRFAFSLRELLRLSSRNAYRISANGVELNVIPATRSILLMKPLDETSILRLIHARSDVLVSPMSERDTAKRVAEGAKPMPIDPLLWRMGTEVDADRLLPDLPQEGYFALKRWPDFGSTAPNRNNLRMASVLTLAAQNINQLAKATNSTPQQARAFINACALLDLVEIRSEVCNTPPLARQHPATRGAPRKRMSGVLESIRSALGLRGN